MSRPKYRTVCRLKVSQDIVPIGDLKAHLSEKIRDLRERGRPLVVTQNGKAAVEEGLEDFEGGRVISNDELAHKLDERFGPLREHK